MRERECGEKEERSPGSQPVIGRSRGAHGWRQLRWRAIYSQQLSATNTPDPQHEPARKAGSISAFRSQLGRWKDPRHVSLRLPRFMQ